MINFKIGIILFTIFTLNIKLLSQRHERPQMTLSELNSILEKYGEKPETNVNTGQLYYSKNEIEKSYSDMKTAKRNVRITKNILTVFKLIGLLMCTIAFIKNEKSEIVDLKERRKWLLFWLTNFIWLFI